MSYYGKTSEQKGLLAHSVTYCVELLVTVLNQFYVIHCSRCLELQNLKYDVFIHLNFK